MDMKFKKAQLESSSFGEQSDEENSWELKKTENLRRPRTWEIQETWKFWEIWESWEIWEP